MAPVSSSSQGTRSRRRERNLQLLSLRINAGLSRVDLERRTGVSRETIRRAELGIAPSWPAQQFAIAKEFGLLPLDLWPLEAQRCVA